MRKHLFVLLSSVLIFSMILASCSSNTGNNGGNTNSNNSSDGTTPSADAEEFELWTFNQLHQEYFEYMVERWNETNSDKQINLTVTTLPYADMHNKLLVALQSGTGAPDIADIEISKFANYLKGTPQLEPLNDIVEPELGNIVESRVDIYSKDGQYYGLPFHVGAAVIYYNKEILDQAGVNPDDIVTWADYETYGKIVLDKTGVPMGTLEVGDQWSFWPQVSQLEGNDDFLKENLEVNLDSPEIIKVLEYQQNLMKQGIVQAAPGNGHHAEEYYGFMNNGGAASVWMPFWYMGRFTDYMPDLDGKMVIKPMPSWEVGSPRSAGMGGTGTVVTNQSDNPRLAKLFLSFAKLSKEGNIEIWKQLGFDPPRTDVWSSDELKESNKFTDYFGTDIFETLLEISNEIEGVNVGEKTPDVSNAVKSTILFRALVEMEDPETVLKEAAEELR